MSLFKKITSRIKQFPAPSPALDWTVSLLGLWFVGGVFVDGWAHNHLDRALETFFTPWHGLLYSGFFVVALAIAVTWFRNIRVGYNWRYALPKGYNASLLGAIIFAGGGVGDMLWHIIFGIEANVEALLSPTHLLLALGGALMVSGPLRALFYRGGKLRSFVQELPLLLSATYFLAILSFMTQHLSPLIQVWMGLLKKTADPFFGQALGTGSILFQTSLLMGVLLLVIKRRSLPWGSFALIFTLQAVALAAMKDQYRFVLPIAVAGMIVDTLQVFCRKQLAAPWFFRLFAFLTPFIYYSAYVAAVMFTEGTWWSVHLWTGAVVLAGIVGWLVSYLVLPPESAVD